VRDPRLDSLLERLSQRPEYRGAALYGSRARGDARDDSDYDVLVLMDEAFGQELVTEDGTFDLVLASEQKMRAFFTAHPDDAIETWRVATILDDPTGVLDRLREDILERERQGQGPSL
jgi:predicted nucleotidyltransferase